MTRRWIAKKLLVLGGHCHIQALIVDDFHPPRCELIRLVWPGKGVNCRSPPEYRPQISREERIPENEGWIEAKDHCRVEPIISSVCFLVACASQSSKSQSTGWEYC